MNIPGTETETKTERKRNKQRIEESKKQQAAHGKKGRKEQHDITTQYRTKTHLRNSSTALSSFDLEVSSCDVYGEAGQVIRLELSRILKTEKREKKRYLRKED